MAMLLLMTMTVGISACDWTQLTRWQEQTGIDLSTEEERDLAALPDYMSDVCIWVETGLRARGFNDDALAKAQRYGKRESRCCPNVVGGNRTGSMCEVIGKFKGMDPTDTGAFQFNGYRPGGGVKDGTPAKMFCMDGVRRFRDGAWTDEVTYPCNQWEVLADPELQLDLIYQKVTSCGFGAWEPVGSGRNKQYPCKSSYVGIVTPGPYMSPSA